MGDAKRILITGASAGFGYSAVQALAAKGHTVYATMRGVSGKNEEKATALRKWAEDGGHTVHVFELDVTNQASVDTAVKSAIDAGGIDVVINNAGLGNWGIDEGFSVDQAQSLFNVNVFGVMRLNRAVLPHFRDNNGGHLMYVSSGLGRIIFPFLAIYASSKFALEGYAESLSYEVGPEGVLSTIIQPGGYGTTFLANCMQPSDDATGKYGPSAKAFQGMSQAFEQMVESGQIGNPQEVVDVIVEEVEQASADRPLRRCIGKDVEEGVNAINATASQVQDAVLSSMGLK